MRILVVEDEADQLILLRYWLGTHYDVVCATRFAEALTLAAGQAFDLFLFDIKLQGPHTGCDLLHALRERSVNRHPPALALTACALAGDRERILQAGFEGYLSKPCRSDTLLQAIQQTLETHTEPAGRRPLLPLSSSLKPTQRVAS